MARRPEVSSARALAEGVYEHLVTEQLARDLGATTAAHVLEALGDDAAHAALALRPHRSRRRVRVPGPVRYESHAGDRPIAITWRLEHAMPAALYERYARLRQG